MARSLPLPLLHVYIKLVNSHVQKIAIPFVTYVQYANINIMITVTNVTLHLHYLISCLLNPTC